MKTKTFKHVVACASFGALCTAHLPAIVESDGILPGPADAEQNSATSHSFSGSNLSRAADLLGNAVETADHRKIGEVRDVLVDPKTGRVPFALVSRGGFFGAGDQWIALPTSCLSRGHARPALVVSMDSDKLKNAPVWERNQGSFDQAWATDVYHYYDLQPDGTASASGAEVREPAGAESMAAYPEGVIENPDERADRVLRLYQKGKGEAARIDRLLQEGKLDLSESSGVAFTDHRMPGSFVALENHTTSSAPSATGKGQFMRSTELMGYQVKNTVDERIGEVKDAVIDLSAGRVAYYVVSMGDKMLALPPDVLGMSTDHGKTFVINLDREKLNTAPVFDRSDWNHAADQSYLVEVYRFYGVPVYFQSITGGNEIQEPAGAELKNREIMKDPAGAEKPGVKKTKDDLYNEGAKPDSTLKDPEGADRDKLNETTKPDSKADKTEKAAPRSENLPKPDADPVPTPDSVPREEKEAK